MSKFNVGDKIVLKISKALITPQSHDYNPVVLQYQKTLGELRGHLGIVDEVLEDSLVLVEFRELGLKISINESYLKIFRFRKPIDYKFYIDEILKNEQLKHYPKPTPPDIEHAENLKSLIKQSQKVNFDRENDVLSYLKLLKNTCRDADNLIRLNELEAHAKDWF